MTFQISNFLSASAAALLLGCTSLGAAHAYEPTGNAIADAFLELLEAEEGTIESYGSVEGSDRSATIEDIRLVQDEGEQVTVTLQKTELSEAQKLANGRLQVGAFSIEGLTLDGDDGSLAIERFSANDLILPSPEEASSKHENGPIAPSYRDLEILNTEVSDETGNAARVERIFVAIDAMDGDLPTASRFALENVVIDADAVDSETRKSLSDLGYESVTLSITGAANWDPTAETAVVDDVRISGPEIGTLQMSLRLGGLSRSVIAELNKNQDDPESALALLQGVTVEAISIRLDNDSLVERVLDMQAKEAGTDRAGIVAQIEGGLPFMLAILQNPEFQTKVSTSLTSFLRDPKSLSIAASPASPVPVAQIMGTVMLAPQTLPQVLGIAISAND
ncbi:hypothetical protein [Roseibium sp.]|uniref:hypothetical protein n=1 Tax=Roseibium sp. TaxID=1936156 RepID=UPI003A96DE55